MALLFKNRKARKFDHKPIYWDHRKEELEKRVNTIKKELIEKGEIVDNNSLIKEKENEDWVEQEARDRISESLFSGASHVNRQRVRGIDNSTRMDRIIKLIIILSILCGIAWYLYF